MQSLIIKNVQFNDMINSRFIQVTTLFKVAVKNIKLTQADYNSQIQIASPKVYASLGFCLLSSLKLQAKISEV